MHRVLCLCFISFVMSVLHFKHILLTVSLIVCYLKKVFLVKLCFQHPAIKWIKHQALVSIGSLVSFALRLNKNFMKIKCKIKKENVLAYKLLFLLARLMFMWRLVCCKSEPRLYLAVFRNIYLLKK